MAKLIGVALILGGVLGVLYCWICTQKDTQIRREETILFLQKMMFSMQNEKMPILVFLERYESKDIILQRSIKELVKKLKSNSYPKGQEAWQEVLKEEESNWNWDKESFGLLIRAGEGFFGRTCEENLCFLQKVIEELEIERKKSKEADKNERKVWIPVSMLGGIMLTILFL